MQDSVFDVGGLLVDLRHVCAIEKQRQPHGYVIRFTFTKGHYIDKVYNWSEFDVDRDMRSLEEAFVKTRQKQVQL